MRAFWLAPAVAAALLLGGCVHPKNGTHSETINIDVALTVVPNNVGGYFFIYEGRFFDKNGDFDFSQEGALYKRVALTFTLSESTQGVAFIGDETMAMPIIEKEKIGEGSPDEPYRGTQFHSFAVSNQGRTLSLIDENNDGVLYRYALRFIDKDEKSFQHDPDGQNGGHG